MTGTTRRRIALGGLACVLAGALGISVARGDGAAGESKNDPKTESMGAPGHSVSRLDWLAGHWILNAGTRQIDEQWLPPAGGIMLGVGRTLRDGKLVEYELVLIAEREGKLVYEAHPSGQETAEFTAIEVSDTSVVFENLAHDFPQRVIYRKQGADSLIARVEGTTPKGAKGSDFPYRRVAADR